jgi:hypothetical protein
MQFSGLLLLYPPGPQPVCAKLQRHVVAAGVAARCEPNRAPAAARWWQVEMSATVGRPVGGDDRTVSRARRTGSIGTRKELARRVE